MKKPAALFAVALLLLLLSSFIDDAKSSRNDPVIPAKRKQNVPNVDRLLDDLVQHSEEKGSGSARTHAKFASLRWSSSVDSVLVEIFLSKGADAFAIQDVIKQSGGNVEAHIDWYADGAISAFVPVTSLAALARLGGVRTVRGVHKPHHDDKPDLVVERRSLSASSTNATGTGTGTALDDPAFTLMKVDQARARCPRLARAGENITIGILAESFNTLGGYASDVAGGYLPGYGNPYGYSQPVYVAHEARVSRADSGRAMAQLVHALAPFAKLCFATVASGSEVTAAAYVLELAGAPCFADVIIDNTIAFGEGYFQDTVWAAAVDTVATQYGAHYLSAVGISRTRNAFVEGTFRPERAFFSPDYYWHRFDIDGAPSPYHLPVSTSNPGFSFINLQWNETFGGATTDLDLFVVDSAGHGVGYGGNSESIGHDPWESSLFTSSSASSYVLVGAYSPSTAFYTGGPKQFVLISDNFLIANFGKAATQRTSYGHAWAQYSYAVGAYNSQTLQLEDYSSSGPGTIYFDSLGNSFGPNGQVRYQPVFTGIDCIETSFFSQLSTGCCTYCATGAATAHAAGVVALVLQAAGGRGSVTQSRMRGILISSSELSLWVYNRGYGLLDASKAVFATGRCGVFPPTPTRKCNIPTPTPNAACDLLSVITATKRGVPLYSNLVGAYPNWLYCAWRISAPPGRRVRITFNQFATESCCDRLSVYDGSSDASPLIFKKGGNLTTPFDVSTGREAFVVFQADGTNRFTGVSAVAYSVGGPKPPPPCDRPPCARPSATRTRGPGPSPTPSLDSSVPTPTPVQVCSGLSTVDATVQGVEFYSNLGGNYPSGINCQWNIYAPVGSFIRMSFTRFNTQPLGDNVLVYSDVSILSGIAVIGVFNGSGLLQTPFDVYTEEIALVTFKPNSGLGGPGFAAVAYVLSRNEVFCSGLQLITATPEGVSFTSNLSPYYINNLNCSWSISAPLGTHLLIRFTRFSVASSFGDYMSVFDGPTAFSPLVFNSLITGSPSNINTGNVALVNFQSFQPKNTIRGNLGFEAIVYAVQDTA